MTARCVSCDDLTFDPAIWRRVKLSEFHAAKEAAEAVAS